MFYILPAIFLGWSLGANDAANLFGPPVVSGLIKYRNATIIAAIFVVLGALIGGTRGLNTLGNLTNLSLIHSSMALFCAALTMTTMTFLGRPLKKSKFDFLLYFIMCFLFGAIYMLYIKI